MVTNLIKFNSDRKVLFKMPEAEEMMEKEEKLVTNFMYQVYNYKYILTRVSSEKEKAFRKKFRIFRENYFFRNHFALFSHFVRSRKMRKFSRNRKCKKVCKKA